MENTYRIAVIGGTGPQGKGLGYRFAKHGHTVVLGSRAAEKAHDAADEVDARLRRGGVTGAANVDACSEADVVLLAVPYDGHDELVATLPLAAQDGHLLREPPRVRQAGPPRPGDRRWRGSAAESAQRIAPDATVVGAFHHVSAKNLWCDEEFLDHEDVLVCGDSAEAKAMAIELARCVTGRDGIEAGKLRLARQLEPLTAVLISVNKAYKTQSGIRISGV